MGKPIYISFDAYYDVFTYNSFLVAAKNNKINIQEFIRIRAPFTRFIKLESEEYLPSFLNYDIATNSDLRWLVSAVKPTETNEAYILRRKPGLDIRYWTFILPKYMKNAHKSNYFISFKIRDINQVIQISKFLGDSTIYYWGKSKLKKYMIFYSYNPDIRNLISPADILQEYGKEAVNSTAINSNSSVPEIPGDIEYLLNFYVLIKEKLEDKTYDCLKIKNGKLKPINRTTFI